LPNNTQDNGAIMQDGKDGVYSLGQLNQSNLVEGG